VGVLPCPDCFVGLDGAFLPCCRWGHESSSTAATAKTPPTLIRKVLAFVSAGTFGGALLICFWDNFQKFTGIFSC
jgi:hypothetical protein